MKTCSKCKRSLSKKYFTKDKNRKDGLYCYCKACHAPISRHATAKWIATHKAHIQKYAKTYCARADVRARRKAYMTNYRKRHHIHLHRYGVAYARNRWLTDIYYRLRMQLRNRLNNAIQRNQKAGSAVRDLGCTIPEFKYYLETLFTPGMTWHNHTRHGWHIHHIRALETFDLSDPAQFKQAVHYTNLAPMWEQTHSMHHNQPQTQ